MSTIRAPWSTSCIDYELSPSEPVRPQRHRSRLASAVRKAADCFRGDERHPGVGNGPVDWAHPDDEAYLCGGITAIAAVAGSHVAYVAAPRWEFGITDPMRWPPEQLAAIRGAELHLP
jgi:hypothetical protein